MQPPYPAVPFKVMATFEHGEVEVHTVTAINYNFDAFFFDTNEEKKRPHRLQANWCLARHCELVSKS